ncbi:MAG: hypothetical protein Q8O37_10805 [Sulfuricellaceae bacterium]|nr:hypothetical protein [Sulfuricellaceae bacterium]
MLILLGCVLSGLLLADDLPVCFNYGCTETAVIQFQPDQLARIQLLFKHAENAEDERHSLAMATGVMQMMAARQSPIGNDKGGNYADDGVHGRMDCIDHSRNTTGFMKLLEEHGWLKFHHVDSPVKRTPLIVNEHWAAQITEQASGQAYTVDSWFFDPGHPAAVFALSEWKNGASPNE